MKLVGSRDNRRPQSRTLPNLLFVRKTTSAQLTVHACLDRSVMDISSISTTSTLLLFFVMAKG